MHKKYFSVFLILISFGINAQSWKKLADFNSSNAITSLSHGHQNKDYALTADRWIYYSEDQGDSWVPFQQVHDFFNVRSLMASDHSNRIFCNTLSSGIAYTDDFGANWNNSNLTDGGGTSGFGGLILATGLKGNLIAVATQGPLSGPVENNLFLSQNNGNTFTELDAIDFYPNSFHFLRDTLVFACTHSGIYHTTDIQSGTWTNTGFSNDLVTDMSFGKDDKIYVSTVDNAGKGSIYVSADYGQSWAPLLSSASYIYGIEKDSIHDQLYSTTADGVYLYDGSWTQISTESRAHEMILTGDQSLLFSGLRVNGIHKTEWNNPGTVEQSNEGLALPADFFVISGDDQIYYGSLYTSFLSRLGLDSALKWSAYTLHDELPMTRISAIQTDTAGNCIVGGIHHITKVADKGKDIEIIADSNTAPLAPIYNQLFPQKLFTGNDGSISMIQHASQNHVDYTPDMGNTWSRLFQSNINGNPAFHILDKVCSGTQTHYILGISQQTSSDVIVASDDDGNTWTTLPSPANSLSIQDIYIDHFDQLYAVVIDDIYKWDAVNEEWNKLNTDFGNESNVDLEIAFDPENRMYILVRTRLNPFPEEGVYRDEDSGQTFTHIPFPDTNGTSISLKYLSFNADGIPIAASNNSERGANLEYEGIYYFSDSTLNITLPDRSVIQDIEMYPNPARNTVHLQLDRKELVHGELIGVNGQVFPIVIENNQFNVSDFTPGLYILKIQEGKKKYQGRLLIVGN